MNQRHPQSRYIHTHHTAAVNEVGESSLLRNEPQSVSQYSTVRTLRRGMYVCSTQRQRGLGGTATSRITTRGRGCWVLHTCMLQYRNTQPLVAFSHLCAAPSTGTHWHTQLARAKRRGRCGLHAAWWGDRRRSVCTSLQHVTAALVKVRLVQPVLLGHERREHVRARLLEVG